MIILLTGASFSGKTTLAQRLLEKYRYPYLCLDHLKMGLIRSGQTTLTPLDDGPLTSYLWQIVREIVKTAIENNQNLIVEGCYIPPNWKSDFSAMYLEHIRYYCLVLTENYITSHFADIKKYADVTETRLPYLCIDYELLIKENISNLELCKKHGNNYILIDKKYDINIEL